MLTEPRLLKRGYGSRGGLSGAVRSLWAPSAAIRYAFYASLLLMGYIFGAGFNIGGRSGTPQPLLTADASSSGGGPDGASWGRGQGSGALGALGVARRALERGLSQMGSGSSIKASSDADLEAALAEFQPDVPLASPDRTLRFSVCNGFANQRIAVLYGSVLAQRLGRSLVLPVLIDNGLQRSDANVNSNEHNQVPFADLYDQAHFIRTMARAGLRVLGPDQAPAPDAYERVALEGLGWSVATPLQQTYNDTAHLQVSCPLFKMQGGDLRPEDDALMWAALDGLRPNPEASALVDQMTAAIVRLGAQLRASGGRASAQAEGQAVAGTGASAGYNFIHLRIENDWVQHCERWEAIHDGIVRDNCYNNTDAIGERLALFGFSNATTLYVGSYWQDVEPGRKERAMAQLAAQGYRVVTSAEVLPLVAAGKTGAGGGLAGRGREYMAMLEYFVGMRSDRFIGNSVSTFAALALLERRHAGRWAAYYNGGNIPLASVLPPLHRLPWVFTYNSWSPGYDYMLKAAVRSANAHRSLKPYCIFSGSEAEREANGSLSIRQWLLEQNVTIITHKPAWRDTLLAKAKSRAKENVQHSHLFKTPDMLVSTFQRVDLPVVPVLDQYTYVLYTDADVFFRRPIRLDDFGLPLPRSVSMSFEFVNMFPYNAGVFVANLPTMRQNYDAFIAMMLADDPGNEGLYYTNFGPADQGILNKFYESDLKSRMLSQAFNTKPYNPYDPGAFIVHFHGPKPHEFLSFLTTGKCDFFTVCEAAFLNSLCAYTDEWVEYVPDELVALRLEDTCTWMEKPAVVEVFKKKWGLTAKPAATQENQGKALEGDHLRSIASAEDGGQYYSDTFGATDQKRVSRMRRALTAQRQRLAAAQAALRLKKEKKLEKLMLQRLKGEGDKKTGETASEEGKASGGKRIRGHRGKKKTQGGTDSKVQQQQQQGAQPTKTEKPKVQPKQEIKRQSFDNAKAVTVDEKALDAAWGSASS
ncbi:hypothetical protein HYH03_002687 [Edaphochlamys debaryana]|uniref:O-fucosyltransferase family protein n=1 Tax=Edaphochlamys debaryana TaxID=47281 RepID=A0A835YB78_9CHLO|nr:hypothetical protein HYH03_002687 [Edaphochlamys debaryana]|eukprot:KAG2499755.1 hypothetical protein HYH03_002687 [Edaphochlamys debaryana]